MLTNNKKSEYRFLFLIASQKLGQKAQDLFSEYHVPMQYHVYAKGTASSEFADLIGLGGIDKSIVITMLPKVFADEMLIRLKNQLYLGTPNSGVAFIVPISGGNAGIMRLM